MSPVALYGSLSAVDGVLQLDNPETSSLVGVDRLSAARRKMRLDTDKLMNLHATGGRVAEEPGPMVTSSESSMEVSGEQAVASIGLRLFRILGFANKH